MRSAGNTLGRLLAGLLILTVIGFLPWLSGTDPARSVLRARNADQDPTVEQLDAVRQELGLGLGPVQHMRQWLAGLLHGDAGRSWVGGDPVAPRVVQALGVSLTLVAGALLVTLLVALLVCLPTVVRGARGTLHRHGANMIAAVLSALPKFALAAMLSTVVGVWWRLLPSQGWSGPESMVLPAIALGVPSGAIIGGLLDQALPAGFQESWVRSWRASGLPMRRAVGPVLRRALAGVLPQFLPTVVALVGGSVAVEQVFNIPGLGRLALKAAIAQDLPVLQTAVLALVLLGALSGLVIQALRRALLGPALTDGALPTLHRSRPEAPRWIIVVGLTSLAVLAVVIALGLLRDPLAVDPGQRLQPPSGAHPLGTDSLGRDLLARLGHGAGSTVGVAVAVTLVAMLTGTAIGMASRLGAGAAEVFATVPAVLVGMVLAGVSQPSTLGAAVAVCLVAWTPYASHACALVEQESASQHIAAARGLGASRWHLLRRHLLPAVAPTMLRAAVLRLPTTILVLASLGFLGLGAQPPAPEWGRLLAEGQPYAEVAPWVPLGPATALVLVSVIAAALPVLWPRGCRGAA